MNNPTPTRILLVDDHDMVRRGLSVFLLAYEDFELVGEAVNGLEAVEKCAELQPDVVLMDLMMPVMDGVISHSDYSRAFSGYPCGRFDKL